MKFDLAFRLVPVILTMGINSAHGSVGRHACEDDLGNFKPSTLKLLRNAAEAAAEKVRRNSPRLDHFRPDLPPPPEQIRDPETPAFLKYILPEQNGLVATARAMTPDTASIGIIDRSRTRPYLTETQFGDSARTTTVFATLNNRLSIPETHAKKRYLVDERHEFAHVHLPGGATTTTGGHAATETTESIVHETGVAALTMDLFAQGDGTANLGGLEDCEKYANLILRFINENIHPAVQKISLDGHSWGAQIVLYMWLHRFEPKYARIVEYFVGSPPADKSEGGDPRKLKENVGNFDRLEAEHDKNMAPGDFAFKQTGLDTNKFSLRGAQALRLSAFGYHFPKMTMEELQAGPRLTISIGTCDGICYLGFEHVFRNAFPAEAFIDFSTIKDWKTFFGDPKRPSSIVLLGDQQNFKTAKEGEDVTEPTGHQLADAILPGTSGPKKLGQKYLVELISRSILSHHDHKKFVTSDENTLDPVLDAAVKAMTRDPAARQFAQRHVEYVMINNKALEALRKRKLVLEGYLEKIKKERRRFVNIERLAVKEALGEVAREFGLGQYLTVGEAEKKIFSVTEAGQRIQAEPVTGEYRVALEAFVRSKEELDVFMNTPAEKGGWVDDLALEEKKQLLTKILEVIDRPGWTHEEVQSLNLKENKKKKFEFTRPQQLAIGGYANDYLTIGKTSGFRASKERLRRLETLPKPPGVDVDVAEAERLLAVEADPERRKLYEKFLERSGAIIAAAKSKTDAELEAAIGAIPLPPETLSEADAQAQSEMQTQLEELSFVPADHPEIAQTVARIKDLRERVVPLDTQLALATGVFDLRMQRNALIRVYTEAVTAHDKTGHSQIRSPSVEAHWAAYPHHQLREDYRLALKALNRTAEQIENRRRGAGELKGELAHTIFNEPEVRPLLQRVLSLKALTTEMHEPVLNLQRQDALAGRLIGDPEKVEFVTTTARKIWGEPGEGKNLTLQLHEEEEKLDEIRLRSEMNEYLLGQARMEYLAQLRAAHLPVPYAMYRVQIKDLFDAVEPRRLIAAMTAADEESRAFVEALKKFNERYDLMHKELSQINLGAKED